MFSMIIGTASIVLIWVLFVGMGLPIWAGVILTIVAGILVLVGFLFAMYFFNIDMKFLSKFQPLLSKFYDRRKKDKK